MVRKQREAVGPGLMSSTNEHKMTVERRTKSKIKKNKLYIAFQFNKIAEGGEGTGI